MNYFRRLLILCGLLAFAALGTAGDGGAASFGVRILEEGACCNGDQLRGSRATISTESDGMFTLASNTLGVERVAAEGDCGSCGGGDHRLIQAGFTGSNISIDPCEGNLLNFVEIIKDGVQTCHPLGAALGARTNKWSVTRDTSGVAIWKAYKNGDLISGSWNSVMFAQNVLIYAGGEINYGTIAGTDVWGWYNDDGLNTCCVPPLEWQRRKADGSWFTIQSSNVCNGTGYPNNCSGGGWYIGPLPSWQVYH